ncbi:tyrosine-type recombinase/integrase [Streptomyces physcomitrii]|uniref:tyrosine-type recombinase/integrase n=1 Tax=Streptomyces physcomitrii TaxID=2724184 RepID=UPI003F4CCA7B
MPIPRRSSAPSASCAPSKKPNGKLRARTGRTGESCSAGRTAARSTPADWEEFKELLAEARIDDQRLYDGSRHTAGTILNELGVDMPTIMEVLRHTRISQTRRYVKGRSHLTKDAMRRIGDILLPAPATPPEQAPRPAIETRTETTVTRTARARRRRRIR